MATLESIRKRGPVVAIVIGFALVMFILGDFINSSGALFSSSQYEVAEISGQTVSYQSYLESFQKLENVFKLRTKKNPDERERMQLNNEAWNMILNKHIMSKQYEELGIDVSDDELFEMVSGKDVDPMVKQAFTDPQTGEFNPAMVVNFLKNMEQDKTGQSAAMWMYIETQLLKDRMFSKYSTLISKGLYVTKEEAKMAYMENSNIVDFDFVMIPFDTIPDTTIAVNDQELKAFYEDRKNYYKQDATREIEYVAFDISPSAEDKKRAFETVENIKVEMAKTDDINEFLIQNGDNPMRALFYERGKLKEEMDSLAFQNGEGFIYGPYSERNVFKLAKVIAKTNIPDSVQARHILIQPSQGVTIDRARQVADSLKQVIEAGGDFAELAKLFGSDGTKDKGGDLGWFKEDAMVEKFSDACFVAELDTLLTVETRFGVHLIEVTDRSEEVEKVRVAFLDYTLEASPETRDSVYRQAMTFAADSRTATTFDENIVKSNLTKRQTPPLRQMQNAIPGLESPRELVQWAFQNEAGKISEVMELGNRYVVAKIGTVRTKGYMPMDAVRQQLEAEIRKDKKFEMLSKDMTGASVSEIASKIGREVKQAQNINFNSFQLPGVGVEQNVIAMASNMKKDEMSKPIRGNRGVYVVKISSVTPPVEKESYKPEIDKIQKDYASRITYRVFEALKELANITDNRSKFF